MNSLDITVGMTERKATAITQALSPEADSDLMRRSRVEIKSNPTELVLAIKSDDLGGLRASLNTYLRWVIMADEVLEVN